MTTKDAAIAKVKRRTLIGAVFIIALITYTVQTELTQYVQTGLRYRKPYFMLYLAHCAYALLLPGQFLYLYYQHGGSARILIRKWLLQFASIGNQLPGLTASSSYRSLNESVLVFGIFPRSLVILELALTIIIAVPSLSWFISVSLTTMPDITAIFNSSCFFAYALSIRMLGERSMLSKWLAVVLAMIGVLVMAYGSTRQHRSTGDDPKLLADNLRDDGVGISTEFIGNVIVAFAAVAYAYYEVFYKKYASPDTSVFDSHQEEHEIEERPRRPSDAQLLDHPRKAVYLTTVTFANTITGFLGILTMFLLWMPIVPLHILGWEPFRLPWIMEDGSTSMTLLFCVFSTSILGLIFNACFMILIALTSPLIASVGNLLTIFLVAIADWLVTGNSLSMADLIGGGLIVIAFVILLAAEPIEDKPEEHTTVFAVEDED